jgi:hypothetical protein
MQFHCSLQLSIVEGARDATADDPALLISPGGDRRGGSAIAIADLGPSHAVFAVLVMS